MRRTSKQSWRFKLLASLVLVILVITLASFWLVFVVYSDELKHTDGTERLRNVFTRQLYALPNAKSGDSPDKVATGSTEEKNIPMAAALATPKMVEEKRNSVQESATAAAPSAPPAPAPADESAKSTANSSNKIIWKKHTGKSCQNYAEGDSIARSLEAAKDKCLKTDSCVAVVCNHGSESYCTLRAIANLVDYGPEDCYEMLEVSPTGKVISLRVHPMYQKLLQEYPFQQVATQTGNQVNIILVRSHMSTYQYKLYQKYKDEILFLGISSMNDYPLKEPGSYDKLDYLGMFPGFLHMMRDPEKHFPPHVKTILMSQSDFSLPDYPARDYSVPKKYDFTYSASDCDVASDGQGWCGWSKNWTFVKEALVVMCGEFNLKGVLVATKDKANRKAYTIPASCKGKMTQTTYLAHQEDYFNFLKQSRFAFLPQIHDASPRVSSQALSLDVPILMNYYILGGWKYVTDKTGEFFHDMSDFRQQLAKILKNSDSPGRYEPRKWVFENYGNAHSGKKLLEFVQTHFADHVRLPKGTKLLLP